VSCNDFPDLLLWIRHCVYYGWHLPQWTLLQSLIPDSYKTKIDTFSEVKDKNIILLEVKQKWSYFEEWKTYLSIIVRISFHIKCFQALLSILDSPLNKAGRLKVVYIRTEKGVLIEVKPYVHIPETFKLFAGLMRKFYLLPICDLIMLALLSCVCLHDFLFVKKWIISYFLLLKHFFLAVELLQKLSISATGKREKLLRTLKNPVTQYLPINARKAGLLLLSNGFEIDSRQCCQSRIAMSSSLFTFFYSIVL
jgi:rRNA pseudouridine-1189 N-methylase Emg1 (Nep1/Mra1 family)